MHYNKKRHLYATQTHANGRLIYNMNENCALGARELAYSQHAKSEFRKTIRDIRNAISIFRLAEAVALKLEGSDRLTTWPWHENYTKESGIACTKAQNHGDNDRVTQSRERSRFNRLKITSPALYFSRRRLRGWSRSLAAVADHRNLLHSSKLRYLSILPLMARKLSQSNKAPV